MNTLTPAEEAVKQLAIAHMAEQGRSVAFRRITTYGTGEHRFYLVGGYGDGVCPDPGCFVVHPVAVSILYMQTPRGYLLIQQESVKMIDDATRIC